jgi:ketosteroid isomerase-like protein
MADEGDSARVAIEAAEARYARYLNGNHTDSIRLMFADAGTIMPPNMPSVTGQDSVADWMRRNAMPPGSTIAFQTVDVAANGPLAIERGTYTFAMPAMGRTPAITSTGKYLVRWHRRASGEWVIVSDIWSEDVPPPPVR